MTLIALDHYGQLVENIYGQLDLKLSGLRDDLRGTGNRTLTDVFNKLDALDNALATVATDKLRISVVDALPSGTNLIGKIAGDQGLALKQVGASDGRLNIYASYVANPSNLDVALSTRLSETTFTNRFPAGTALSDALSNPTTTLIGSCLLGFDGTNWERIKTDGSNRLYVNAAVVANPSNLDVALSTRASETTLSGLSGKFPSATALADNLGNPTTTLIGACLLGWDGTYFRRLAIDTTSRLRTVVESIPSIPSGTNTIGSILGDYTTSTSINGTVGTTEVVGNAVDIRKRGGKIIYMKNTQDVGVTVTIEGSYDGTNWFTIRDNISLAATNGQAVGILTDRYGYVRARATGSGSPTTGSVVVTVSAMTF